MTNALASAPSCGKSPHICAKRQYMYFCTSSEASKLSTCAASAFAAGTSCASLELTKKIKKNMEKGENSKYIEPSIKKKSSACVCVYVCVWFLCL
jgi:hypothetical protein